MRILVNKRLYNSLFIFQNSVRKSDNALSVVGKPGGYAIASPNDLRNVTQRKLLAQLAQTDKCG
jgi:hypothetical protein